MKRMEDFKMELKELLGEAYKEGMTVEEIETALKGVAPPAAANDSAAELTRLKAALSRANSEAADYKKQLRSKQTADEAAAAAKQEEYDKLMRENADLKRSMALSEKKAKLLAMGYEEKLAESTAAAMVDGDMDTVMGNQAQYLETQKKAILADKMKQTPRPMVGGENAGGMEYQKKVEEAQASGDFAAAAYYTRLAAQDAAAQTE